MSPSQSLVTPFSLGAIVGALQLPIPSAAKQKTTQAALTANSSQLVEGSRNNTLASIAGAMRARGLATAAIEVALLAHNASSADPLDDDEVSKIAASIGRYQAGSADDMPPDRNDTGNGERFVRQFGDVVRFVSEQKQWLTLAAGQWSFADGGQIAELAKKAGKAIYEEAQQSSTLEDRKALSRHANTSLSRPRLDAMLASAQSIPSIQLSGSQLDAEPMLLGVANGIVDLRNGNLLPYSADHYITTRSPVVFDANATCPRFIQFMDEITGGDAALVQYLHRVIGYTLTGLTTEQVFFFLYGSGANGKSTFLNVLRELLGKGLAKKVQPETFMLAKQGRQQSNDVARLIGVRMADTTEIDEGQRLDEARLKEFTGGDPQTARHLYREHFEFTPCFKIYMSGNHKPKIFGADHGIWRRIHLVPFTQTFNATNRDAKLLETLLSELPGILNWAIKGCLDWQITGLCPPKRITDAVAEYQEQSDVMGEWIAEKCDTQPAVRGTASALYCSYRNWAEECGYRPLARNTFGIKLVERGYQRVRTNTGNIYSGITLK